MDFQEILKTFAQRASSDNKGGNNAFSINGKFIFTIVILGIIIVAGLTSFYMVDQTEQSVVTRFGEYNRTTNPGLHFKLPLFIEKNFNVATQKVQSKSFGFRTDKAGIVSRRSSIDYSTESTMLTGDLNIVSVEWIIQYRINDPRAWLFNVSDPNKTIRDISISVVNQLVGDYYITDILGDARTEIEVAAESEMNRLLNAYQLGVRVDAVKLQNIVPPAGRVQDAFEDVNKAIQDMNKLINEGKEEYNKEIPKSRGKAAQVLEQAKGYATERVNEAEGDVARFSSVVAEYRRNPQITRDRIYYETIESILDSDGETGRTQFLDGRFDNLVPFLPLSNNKSSIVQ